MTDKEAMAKELEELAKRFSEGWHEGIKIDASDIMLLSQAAEALAQPEQEPVAWHTNSPSDPEICNERSAQACGPVYCGDSGGYCNKCPKQKIIQAVKPCKGMNCGCTDGRSHSLECLAELAAAIAGGVFVQEALKEKNA
jgi:hypothetical protein